jgi:hypothetical protein
VAQGRLDFAHLTALEVDAGLLDELVEAPGHGITFDLPFPQLILKYGKPSRKLAQLLSRELPYQCLRSLQAIGHDRIFFTR